MSSVVISGDTSGTVSLTVPAVAGTNTATLPAATGTVVLTNVTGNVDINAAGSNYVTLSTNTTERMRIDASGNLYKGGTSGPSGTAGAQINVNYVGSTQMGLFLLDGEASGTSRNAVRFERTSGNTVGSITTTNSATAYNTSSDYRLKVNPVPMVGALDKVLALKPVTYQWKIDGSDGEGFIAHELQEVIPNAVTGIKDDVNEDGSINPQAVDYSKLVATLVSAIQELKAEIDLLKEVK
jgi:hypothetical protein